MARFVKKRDQLHGVAPGTPVFVGEQHMEMINLRTIDYGPAHLEEKTLQVITEIKPLLDKESVTWVNIDGLHDTESIKQIGDFFNLHPLVLEDITNSDQRPKVEEYDNYLFIVVKMLVHDPNDGIVADQLSMVVGPNYVLTFQERIGKVFEPVRERIRKSIGRVRKMGADYLAYVLLDTVVDNYFILMEQIGAAIEDMEIDLLANIQPEYVRNLNYYKGEINFIRKQLRPVRDSLTKLARLDSDMLNEGSRIFYRDLDDLMLQVFEVIESYRELLIDHWNIYNTHISNRLNEIIKVLTIFSVIFIPLTFIAGVYGTNFEYLPELYYRYSYYVFWIALVLIAGGMLVYFKRKGWL